jgi:hypothetical protein
MNSAVDPLPADRFVFIGNSSRQTIEKDPDFGQETTPAGAERGEVDKAALE